MDSHTTERTRQEEVLPGYHDWVNAELKLFLLSWVMTTSPIITAYIAGHQKLPSNIETVDSNADPL
jgi:hypothetical protein